jgi:hypothetical protein
MELGVVAQSALRVGAAADLRAGVERITLGARLLAPLLQGAAGAVPTELARDLRAAIANDSSSTLVLPAQASQGAARLEVGGRQIPIPAAMRDALLAAAGAERAAAPPSTVAPPAGGAPTAQGPAPTDAARAWAVAAQTTSAAAVAVSGSGLSRNVQRAPNDRPAPTVRFEAPLFEPVNEVRAVQAAAERLRQGVERSGLFFESHVAQWAQGARDTAELRAEALRLLPAGGGAAEAGAQRVAAQVAVLQEALVTLQGPAWPGQPAMLTIAREAHAPAEEAVEPVFTARLALDLPALGTVVVQLRLAGDAVGTTVAAAERGPFDAALPELAERLRAHGLQPIALHAVAADSLH